MAITADQIQMIADAIYDAPDCGRPSQQVSLRIARLVSELLSHKIEPPTPPVPGFIAQHRRERYQETPILSDAPLICIHCFRAHPAEFCSFVQEENRFSS